MDRVGTRGAPGIAPRRYNSPRSAGSSNGRTPDSGSGSLGSSPSPAARRNPPQTAGFWVQSARSHRRGGNVGGNASCVGAGRKKDAWTGELEWRFDSRRLNCKEPAPPARRVLRTRCTPRASPRDAAPSAGGDALLPCQPRSRRGQWRFAARSLPRLKFPVARARSPCCSPPSARASRSVRRRPASPATTVTVRPCHETNTRPSFASRKPNVPPRGLPPAARAAARGKYRWRPAWRQILEAIGATHAPRSRVSRSWARSAAASR